jgi:hypothetical protein
LEKFFSRGDYKKPVAVEHCPAVPEEEKKE